MQGQLIAFPFHVPGTLAADVTIKFAVPQKMALYHVGAVASNASSATLKVGTSADDDGFKTAAAIGQSSVPTEWKAADLNGGLLTFAGAEHPMLAAGTIVVLTLDHDGAAGTAAQNVTIVATFVQ